MSLSVKLDGNSTGFQQMLKTAQTQAKAFSNSVSHEVGSSWGSIGKSLATGIAGAFTVEGIKSGLEWFIDTGKQIKDTAEQVDMSTDSWQKWSEAVEKAGLSTEGFQRIIEALHQKRTDALTDPKARGQLNRLGFSDADITGNMDMDTFTKKALGNAAAGDLQRGYLADVIGARGLKYAGAVKGFDEAEPLFRKQDLDNAMKGEEAERAIKKGVGKIGVQAARDIASTLEDIPKHPLGLSWSPRKMFWNWFGLTSMKIAQLPISSTRGANSAPLINSSGDIKNQPTKNKVDPLDAILERQKEEMALEEQQRQERLDDSRRGLMTIGDRRRSIAGEIPGLQKQLADRNAKLKSGDYLTDADKTDLDGVTGKAREIEINKLRQKYQSDTDNVELRLNSQREALKEKPLSFEADSMAKTGLYSASALQFNPLLSIGQETNKLLRQVVTNTTPKVFDKLQDPHAR